MATYKLIKRDGYPEWSTKDKELFDGLDIITGTCTVAYFVSKFPNDWQEIKSENTITTPWDFVEIYYPNYTSSDEIAENGDLQKIIDGEIDEDVQELYNSVKEEIRAYFGHTLEGDELENETFKEFENRKSASDASIYEATIQGYIESLNNQQEPKKTYYLLGEDAVKEYHETGIDGVLDRHKNNEITYSAFIFTEGVTPSENLADVMDGWWNYTTITKEEHDKL